MEKHYVIVFTLGIIAFAVFWWAVLYLQREAVAMAKDHYLGLARSDGYEDAAEAALRSWRRSKKALCILERLLPIGYR